MLLLLFYCCVKGISRNSSAVTVTKDSVMKSARSEFTDAEKLFTYMIEPVPPPKFFK